MDECGATLLMAVIVFYKTSVYGTLQVLADTASHFILILFFDAEMHLVSSRIKYLKKIVS